MTIRQTIAATALCTAALFSGAALAADFSSQLSEARIASQTTGKSTRMAVTPALNAALSLNAQGRQEEAQDYLAFARGKLDLPVSSALTASPVVAVPTDSLGE